MKAVLFLLTTVTVLAAGANYTAVVYESNSNRQKQLFTYSNQKTEKDGMEEIQAVYKDPQGQVVIEEKSVVKGSQALKVEIDQKQVNKKALIEVKDGKVFFTKTEDGKTTTKEEKLGSTFVVGANFMKFIKDNWDQISGGKTIAFRFGVWDRQETVGFEISKVGETDVGGQKAVLLKMKPSSFIIAALVKPIQFTYSADGTRLLVRNGRVEPKKKDGSAYKDLDAEMVYSY